MDDVDSIFLFCFITTYLPRNGAVSARSRTRHRQKSLASMAGAGTGEKLTRATIIVAGVASLVASLLSIV